MLNTGYREHSEDIDEIPIAEAFFRRFNSRLAGLLSPQARGNFAGEESARSSRCGSQRKRRGTDANSPKPSLIPLQFASLCLNCEMITPALGRCIACGSVALLNIAKTLSHAHAIKLPRNDDLAVTAIAS